MSGTLLSESVFWSLKEPKYRDSVLRDEIPGMCLLGLGVERNSEDGLRNTKEELGNSMCLWAESSEGMRKPGNLKEGAKNGAEQKGVLNTQRNNLTKPLVKQLNVSIIEIRRWN